MLDPSEHAIPDATGTAVLLGDGQEWLFADYVPALGEPWDSLYDANQLRGKYDPEEIQVAAYLLLRAANVLSAEEAADLIAATIPQALVPAVEAALFGPDLPIRSFSDWAINSLCANGIDPRMIPPANLRGVLDYLVATGRAIPENRYITSVIRAAKRSEMRDMARRKAPAG